MKVGEEVIIECTSHGVPEPSYKITHIDTETVHNEKTFTISEAKLSDNGTYECVAWNKLGNDSDSKNVIVVGKTRFQVDNSRYHKHPNSITVLLYIALSLTV